MIKIDSQEILVTLSHKYRYRKDFEQIMKVCNNSLKEPISEEKLGKLVTLCKDAAQKTFHKALYGKVK